MEAQADSLLSPITTAADRSDSTTMLVSEGSGLPRILHQAFNDGARPPPFNGSPSRARRVEVSDFLLILQNDHKNQCNLCIFFLQGGRLGCRFLNFYQFSNSNWEQKNKMYKIDY